MTRADLEDAIWETLQDTCDMDVTTRDYARAIVMMLETKGVVRCEADAEMLDALKRLECETQHLCKQLAARGLPGVPGDTVDMVLLAAQTAIVKAESAS